MDLKDLTCSNCGAPLSHLKGHLTVGSTVACRYCGRSFAVEAPARPPPPSGEGCGRVTMALPDGSFIGRCQARVEAHGLRSGSISGTNFSGWSPAGPSDLLLVAALADQPPMDAGLCDDHLPRPWPELVALLGQQPSANFEGRTRSGHRVLVTCARDRVELRRAIATLQLGAEHVAPSPLPIHDLPSDATRVSLVVPDGSYTGPCQLRLEALGYRPWTTWGTNFQDWKPATDDEVLLIAVCAGIPPFDARLWPAYLGRPWPDLEQEIGTQLRVQQERRTSRGRRVVIVGGADRGALRQAIEELRF